MSVLQAVSPVLRLAPFRGPPKMAAVMDGMPAVCKPPASPSMVRIHHLPPPAETACHLLKRRPVGRFFLSPVCHDVPLQALNSDGYGHMADSVPAERAVRGTSCFADLG